MMSFFKRLCLPLMVMITMLSIAQERTNPYNQSEELGKVSWYRNYQQALTLSKKENKPVLILFQEVPGCSTCRNYGHNVLSHPLMTETIENEFIPLAIFNNKGGEDKKILNLYREPAWNNPVVRIVDANGKNLVPRVAGNYSAKGLYDAIIKTLNQTSKKIPEYVEILGKEIGATNTSLQEDYYKMYCFWSGEGFLGNIDGVLSTKAGFMNGEVVKVTYDPLKLSSETLQNLATRNRMQKVKKTNFRWSQSDEDYYLQHSPLKYIPLTEIQRTKINSALINKKDPLIYLSPKQLAWAKTSTRKEVLFDKDFAKTWLELNKKTL